MPVIYDEESGGLAVAPDECGCGRPWYDTGCAAPGCLGQWCPECGTGCDIEVAPEDGTCAAALAEESDEEAAERINRERAAFGLRPLSGEG
jgi:hypothetical protein